MIAVALGLIALVVTVATGVVISSDGDDHLAFLGVGVQTTTAQVFVTGAIFGWLLLVALWLLRIGMHRSGERGSQLAARRGRASGWLGFGDPEGEAGLGGDDEGWDEWPEGDEWSGGPGRGEGIIDRTGAARHRGGAPGRPDSGLDDADRAVAATPDQPGPLDPHCPSGPVTGPLPADGVDSGAQGSQIGGGPGPMPGEDRGPDGEYRGRGGGQ